MWWQQCATILTKADTGRRPGLARAGILRRMDGREAVNIASRVRYRSKGKMVHRRRSRWAALDAQRSAREGTGRCDGCALSERRAADAGKRLSHAPIAAGL